MSIKPSLQRKPHQKLYSAFVLAIVTSGLSGCGRNSDARKDPGVEVLPAQVVVSSKAERDQTLILMDLLDRDLVSARDDNIVRFKFFKSISPAAVSAMLEVEAERKIVFEYEAALKSGQKISEKLQADISVIFLRYKTKNIEELLSRVDTVPLDLLFIQASVESAAGKSGVSRDCHNIFGVHAADKTQSCPGHPILAYYPDFSGSIKRYMLLLNSGGAFKAFRQSRSKLRASVGEFGALDSQVLVQGLLPYSERGQAYVRQISAGIQETHLDELYREFMQKID